MPATGEDVATQDISADPGGISVPKLSEDTRLVYSALWEQAADDAEKSGVKLPLTSGKPEDRINEALLTVIKYKKEYWGNISKKTRRQECVLGEDHDGGVTKMIQALNKATEVLNPVISNGPIYVGIPWMGLCLILQVSNEILELRKTLLTGLTTVTELIIWSVNVLNVSLLANTTMHLEIKKLLVKLHKSILRYLSHVIASFGGQDERTLRVVVKASLRIISNLGKHEQIRDELEEMQKVRAQLEALTDLEAGQVTSEKRAAIQAMHTYLHGLKRQRDEDSNNQANANERADVVRWLNLPLLATLKTYDELRINPLEGSGAWLRTSPEYLRWKRSPESSIFWLSAPLGAGKTMVTTSVVQELTAESANANKHIPLALFYCRRDNDHPEGTALITFSAYLYTTFLSQMANNHRSGILYSRLTKLTKNAIIVDDGLDECQDSGRRELLNFLKMTTEKCRCIIKIFVSSRVEPDIEYAFKSIHPLSPATFNNTSDIQRYIKKEIEAANGESRLLNVVDITKEREHHIAKSLAQKASG
ncbi:hypothetical protein MMC25_004093, partial [Agyrium rufum]|nr:hypothetical protein [Agyrium rufum]